MNDPAKLTEIQRRILNVFRSRADASLAPPTYRELCREFGWSSTGTARDHLRALIRKGALEPGAGRARGAHLHRARSTGTITMPVVGRIVAGRPVDSQELVDEEIAVPSFLAPMRQGFLLRVSGDSMEGAGIFEGDLVIVRKSNDPRPGEIVAVTLSGETTLKRLQRRGEGWILVPENPRYSVIPINTEDVKIHGTVTGVLRAIGPSNEGRHRPPDIKVRGD